MSKRIQSSKYLWERQGKITAEQRQKMMTPDQILEMPLGEMLLLMGSKRPVKSQTILSYKHPVYPLRIE